MKIALRGHETCGLIGNLAAEFRRRGHDVLTIALPHKFFPGQFDYDPYDLLAQSLARGIRPARLADLGAKALWEITPRGYQAIERRIERSLLRGVDLLVQVWAGLPREAPLFAALRRQGTRIASLFMGSDVREYNMFFRQYDVGAWTFPAEYFRVPLAEKLATLRRHELYADALFSVPDQMGLALRPYYHLQVPLELSTMRYSVPGRERPRVLHAPSIPHVKGTDVIERALDALRADGVDFEFVSVRNVAHSTLLDQLADADVVVDELVGHGPGWLGFEAMASGCAVATRYLSDSPPCFRPPVIAIDQHNIATRLRELLTDRGLRIRLAEAGRAYVECNNSIQLVTDSLVAKALHPGGAECDYVPDYLTTTYVPENEAIADAINSANRLVADQPWYREHAAGRSHDGLVF